MQEIITLDYGSGGLKTAQLIDQILVPAFANTALCQLGDGAVLPPLEGPPVFSTDSFVVTPWRFPGGDIGKLAVCGTVNDLCMAGGVPRYLSFSLILEEGFALDDLRAVVASAAEAARQAGVQIVTGDTKVVERGRGDGIYINTAGVGVLRAPGLGRDALRQAVSTHRIDVIATLISMNGTLADLKELELCYSPVYGTAKDVVNLAALVGLNVLEGRVKQVPVTAVRRLVEQGACIIDVREEREFNAGHLKGAVNIPLSRFQERMNEVPKDVPVYLHCRTSQRSYYALCELLGNGYTNVYNISGSFLGICLYEYFNDRTLGREPIVTAYNFN